MPRRMWAVSYDIANPKRLRRVERAVSAVGQRVHYSFFLCELTPKTLNHLQRRLARMIDHSEDRVQYQPLCHSDLKRTRHLGYSSLPERQNTWII